MRHGSLRRLIATLLLGVLLLNLACGGRNSVYPVSGKVLFDGKPAEGAVVQFHPKNKSGKVVVPVGRVGADGTFRLTSYKQDDGAPAGEYTVTVFWGVPSRGGDDYERILVPPRYLSPETSGLTAVVADHATELEPFQLKN
jgi:hypothetical protein